MARDPFESRLRIVLIIVTIILLIGLVERSFGHPHVFIDTTTTFIFDSQGLMKIQCEWRHDAYTSADALANYDEDGDGQLSDLEISSLAEGLKKDLLQFQYFTVLRIDGEKHPVEEIQDVQVWYHLRKVWLTFTLPCRIEAGSEPREVRIAQYDPDNYIDFKPTPLGYDITRNKAIHFEVRAGKAADLAYFGGALHPHELTLRFQKRLADGPVDLQPEQSSGNPESPAPVDTAISIDTDAAVESVDSGFSLVEWSTLQQRQLQSRMENLLSAERARGGLGLLCLLAFAYGVLHAAGPGHGKVITASWLAAGKRRLSSGIALGCLLALFHGLSGVAVVLAGRFIMEKTAMSALGEADKPLKVLSFTMIAALGCYMLAREIHLFRRRAGDDVSSNAAETTSSCSEMDARVAISPLRQGNRKNGSLVMIALAAGLIPCPGVVLVMLFASALGYTLTGLLLAACVTLGMALTISFVGVLVLGLREATFRLPHLRLWNGATIESVMGFSGGAMLILLGVSFLWMTLQG